jgi:3-phosphoshikimate 1-carboxyvinyltransferase
MGADIREDSRRERGSEIVADLRVRHARLRGIEVPLEHVPDMIDEFPILFIAAAAAAGTTTIRGAAELRVKESDRIATMVEGLRALGIRIAEKPDGAVIEGGKLCGGRIDSCGDHRVAMSFAVAGAVASDSVTIGDCANVGTSFPGFFELANRVGFALGRGG